MGLAACSSAVPTVQSSASIDFDCPYDEVAVARMGGGRYRAIGCGQYAVYGCAISDDYVCVAESSGSEEGEEGSATQRETSPPAPTDPLILAINRCGIEERRVVIQFGADSQASGIEFSDEVTSEQRSCVARAAAENRHEPGEFIWPLPARE